MKRKSLLKISRLILSSTLLFLIHYSAEATTPPKLQQLDNKISTIKTLLSKEKSKRSSLQQDLKKTEITAGKILIALRKTEADLKTHQAVLQQLSATAANYQSKLMQEHSSLESQMKAAYIFSRQPYLKFILSQSSTDKISRILKYYQYFSHDELSAIQALQNTLTTLQTNQQDIKSQAQILEALENKQKSEHDKLAHMQLDRKVIIQQINSSIQTKSEKLSQLLANKRLLEQTIYQVNQETEIRVAIKEDFDRLKGKLPWPAKGKVFPYFGTRIDQSELRWGGTLIEAAEDEPVRAIASGQVMFARWLPGYGLLLIISHGHGYMTLYGRNHYLYKKLGDIVEKGDLIATVGNSGGYEKPALYFAIRHNAKPLNPADWCNQEI